MKEILPLKYTPKIWFNFSLRKFLYLMQSVSSMRRQGYKTFFMLNSDEHENFPAHKC